MRILYVDDDAISALVFEETLPLYLSAELRIAETCRQALAIARHWRPDVLVLDAHLPDGNGLDLMRALRALPGHEKVPVFMCSGDGMPADIREALDAGPAGYWIKPVDFAVVVADLRRCLPAA